MAGKYLSNGDIIMTIVGFNFTKMLVERKSNPSGKVNITNNVSIKNVEEMDLSFGQSKQKGIKYSFEFNSKYEPKVGIITLNGELVSIEPEDKIKKILEDWKKEQKVKKDTMVVLLNNILAKCNIQALILSKDINLPPPIVLPKVNEEQKK